jgi:thymidylate synthase
MSFEDFSKIGEGSVGKNYSAQWRNFNGNTDQIQNLIDDMKNNIMGSRLKVNAWNPSEVDATALPPCHSEFQVIGVPLEDGEFGFELHWNQRSVDTFLGLPFNIASYGLLAKILEQITGYKALGIEGTLKCVHFYDNQYKKLEHQEKSAVEVLMERDANEHPNCDVDIKFPYRQENTLDGWLNNLKIEDFELVGYSAHPKIAVEMLAPKEV